MNDLFHNLPRIVKGYEIKSGLPIAADKQGRERAKWDKPDFPFEALRNGDCFDVPPLHDLDLLRTQNMVSGAACQYRKKHGPSGWNFTTRQMNGFVRCWRRDNPANSGHEEREY
jgi:hypothetical protein